MFSFTRKTLFVVNLCLFLSFLDTATAEIQKGDYLWLDYRVQDDKGGVRGSQQLFICYGQLPDKKGDITELQQLEVFCTFGEKDRQGVLVYYKLNINEDPDKHPFVIIKSQKDTWCGVLAKAINKGDKKACLYTASTSFFVQGDSGESIDKEKYNHDILAGGIDIALFHERIKEDNTIYRRIGFPLSFAVRFSGRPLSKRNVLVVDDVGKIIQSRTDWWGKFAYQPVGLRKFREDVIVVEHEDRDYLYKSTYTVFFRQGSGSHAKIRNLNMPFGVAIFFASFFAGSVLVLIKRKKFSDENL